MDQAKKLNDLLRQVGNMKFMHILFYGSIFVLISQSTFGVRAVGEDEFVKPKSSDHGLYADKSFLKKPLKLPRNYMDIWTINNSSETHSLVELRILVVDSNAIVIFNQMVENKLPLTLPAYEINKNEAIFSYIEAGRLKVVSVPVLPEHLSWVNSDGLNWAEGLRGILAKDIFNNTFRE